MTTGQTITDIEEFNAPWNKTVTMQNVAYDGGANFIRFRIKEGKRFTDLELDPATARRLIDLIRTWVDAQPAS